MTKLLKMNKKMELAIKGGFSRISLNDELGGIANSGFLENRGCFLISEMYGSEYDSYDIKKDFTDEIGFEAFVNHLHIEDYCSSKLVSNAISYMSQVFDNWNLAYGDKELRFIYSISPGLDNSEKSHTVRNYVHRSGQDYLVDDLEGYEMEAVLLISSDSMPELLSLSHTRK